MAGNPYGDKPATENPYGDAPANENPSYGKRFRGALAAELDIASGIASVPFVGLHALGDYALKNIFGNGTSYEKSLEHAQNTTGNFIHQEPSTQVGKDTAEMFQHGIDAARDYTGRGLEHMGRVVSEGTGLKMDTNILRGTGEGLFDLASGPLLGKGYKGAKGRLTRIPSVDEISAKGQEPILPTSEVTAPEVDVVGRRDPKVLDYETLGYDAEDLPKLGPETPVSDTRAEPFLGVEPEVNNLAPEPTNNTPSMGVPFEPPITPMEPPAKASLATDTSVGRPNVNPYGDAPVTMDTFHEPFPLDRGPLDSRRNLRVQPETIEPTQQGPDGRTYDPNAVDFQPSTEPTLPNRAGPETVDPMASAQVPVESGFRAIGEGTPLPPDIPSVSRDIPLDKRTRSSPETIDYTTDVPAGKVRIKPKSGQEAMREINKGIGGKQSGAVNFGEIADGLQDLYNKAKAKGGEAVEDFMRAFKAFMDVPDPKEGFDEGIKRAIEAYKDKPENTAVFRNNERGGAEPRPFNKGFGGKQSGAVKLPGGVWHPEFVENLSDHLVESLGRDTLNRLNEDRMAGALSQEEVNLRMDEQYQPLVLWADKTIRNYLNKYAGTSRDPLKDLRTPMFGDNVRWEDITDQVFHNIQVPERTGASVMHSARVGEPVWAGKDEFVNPRTELLTDYINHVGDYLREHVDPKKLPQYDFVRAVKETAAQDERQAKKMLAARGTNAGTSVYKEYPDGMKWVEVGKVDELPDDFKIVDAPDWTLDPNNPVRKKAVIYKGKPWSWYEDSPYKNTTEEKGRPHHAPMTVYGSEAEAIKSVKDRIAEYALKNEGDVMGHCVGGYCEAVNSGHSKIYSLRDRQGNSHVTIEVNPRSHPMNARGMEVERWLANKIGGKEFKDIPDIAQIKGKQNRAPIDEYKPYVQDFIKSGDWGRVGDLVNAGLMDKRTAFNHFEDMINVNKKIGPSESRDIKAKIKQDLEAGGELGRNYFSHDEIIDLEKKYNLMRDDPNVPLNRSPYGGPGGRQRGSLDISEIGKGLSKLFGGKDAERPSEPSREPPREEDRRPMVEQKRYLTADTRSVDKFLQDELGHAKDWTDIKKRWTEFFPGSTIASVAREHKAIKWIGDKVLTADREARVAKEDSKYGREFAASREITSGKFNRRVRSDDGALTVLQRLPVEESSRAIRLWLEKYDGKNIDMNERTLAADGMNRLQIKGLLAAKKQFADFLTKYNEAAEKEGFSPISVQPNYFPHLWKGDYRVIAKDVNNHKVWIEGADTELQAKTIRDDLQKKFPDHQIEWKEAGSRYDLDNTDAFRDAIGILDKDDPARKILQRAFEDVLSHRGFKRQTIFREGRPGFLGTKEGTQGLRDAMLAMEMYFDRGHNFLANQQKKAALANLIQGLREGGYDMERETRNAYNYINAFVDNSTGGIKNGIVNIDTAVESLGEFVGLGKSAGSNALGVVNGLASAWWLTTPKFVLAQLVQPLYNLSKATQLKSAGITEKSAVASYMKSYYETFFDPSATTVEGLNWAKENGFIDSKILDMMGAKFDPKLKKTAGAFQTFSKWGLGKIEEEVVRAPSFVFYDHLLRDSIPDKVERWTAAGQMTDKYMVDYTRSDTPLFYGRNGLVGEALRPLKQFSHAYYGQMLEYIYDMKHEKTAKPLAMFLGTQMAVAGMKGMIGFAEWTIAATAINSLFNTTIPTGEEWLAEHVGSLFTFGGVSELSGIDMSGTLGAPQASQMGGFPGAQFAGKAVKNVGTYLGDESSGLGRQSNKMKALQSVAPNVLQGRVEKAYTPEGQPPPNPNNKMQPDLARPRTDKDWFMRDMGGRSVKEAQEMLRLRALKQETKQIETQRGKYLDTMVDRLVQGKEVDQSLIDGYVERGGDPNSIANSIVEQMKNRVRGAGERYLNVTNPNMSTAEKAMRLQKYNLLTDQITDPDEMAALLREIENAKQ